MLKRILIMLALIYFGSIAVMMVRENHYLYHPKVYPKEYFDPDRFGLDFEDVYLTLSDETKVHGWWLPGLGGESSPVVLFLHGNAGHIADRMDLIRLLLSHTGVPLGGVLAMDYPGFGRSGGRPSENGCYETALKYYRYLRSKRRISPDRIIIFGRSLGAAVALHTAVGNPCRGVILEVPFLSIPRMAEDYYPFLPGLKYMVRQKFDNERIIRRLTVPLMIIIGTKDRVISASHGRRLFQLAPEPKRLIVIPGAGHSDTYLMKPRLYWRAWRQFLTDLGFPVRKPGEGSPDGSAVRG